VQSLYLFSTTPRAELPSILDRLAAPNDARNQWCFPSVEAAELRIELAADFLDELEPELRARLAEALGSAPAVTVIVDVSRRGARRDSTIDLVLDLMQRLNAVACDDNSEHVWRAADVAAGAFDGQTFAQGYFRDALHDEGLSKGRAE
jgi:hypothetical protein